MTEILEETKLYITFRFICWGRAYRIKLSKVRNPREILYFKSVDTSLQTLPETMLPLYESYERTHEWGENGVQKYTDLITYLNIKEI